MNFDEYQIKAGETSSRIQLLDVFELPPSSFAQTAGLLYPVLGLQSEAGEVAGVVKRILRDDDGEFSVERRDALLLELGDVLWYVAEVCTILGAPLSEVAGMNVKKLNGRKTRGTINGSGDYR